MHSCTKARCKRCRLHEELCLCAEIPLLSTRTRVALLMHAQEANKPSNTGRLAHLCLPNSEIRYRGLKDGTPLNLEGLVDDEYETWMLYLSDRSESLSDSLVRDVKKPVRLLVLDGNWSQASRLGAKLARQLPLAKHVKLSSGRPSEYRLRTEHHPDGLATFEAIARALGYLEGREVQEKMEALFRRMTDRVLWTRGKLAAEAVTGGLPNR
ncbi:MAG TPA: tRNA-uridine aminocarboxypropyltransferase [Bdellovibrionota bacterium]|jgi:DTW domain-containing protein YfiP